MREELVRGVDRLERGKEVLTQASSRVIEANTAGENLLGALREQRETLVRAGTTLGQTQANMKNNEKLVGDMNSWTRLGAKATRTPWGW